MSFYKKVAALLAPAIITAVPFLPAPEVKASPIVSASTVLAVTSQQQTENPTFFILKIALAVGGTAGVISILAAFLFRKVVNTNTVHIVQSGKSTIPYGANLPNGNVYYEVPTWVPKFGVSVIKLPVNNFDLSLQDYEAYDEDRVPFLVDVTAFFRIDSPSIAAQRITDVKELKHQLSLIVQGAVRKVLASDKIDNIMTQRSTFGESFSNEVKGQLAEWGVSSVRSMELMDIRDSHKSNVIASIMAKKISEIEKDSRITVAENNRLATVAEVENKRTSEISTVEAEREISLSRQVAEQQVGERAAEKEKAVGVAKEQSQQEVLLAKAITKEKDIAVKRVEELRTAEVERDRALVLAEKDKKVATIDKETALVLAAQEKETTVLIAEGKLEAEKKKAEAIQATGVAEAEAKKALELAPVTAQITLAKEIGSNDSYQKYLALIEALKAYTAVGSEQAKSLQQAEVKVIANGGTAPEGITKVMDIFTTKGGTSIAAAIEALSNSEVGAELLSRLSGSKASDQG
jgi:flotillin